jgi:hypothetical protein
MEVFCRCWHISPGPRGYVPGAMEFVVCCFKLEIKIEFRPEKQNYLRFLGHLMMGNNFEGLFQFLQQSTLCFVEQNCLGLEKYINNSKIFKSLKIE